MKGGGGAMRRSRAQHRLKSSATDVYRVYDWSGCLLYVGTSVNVFVRMREHRRYSGWWPHAFEGTVHRYENRTIARHVEATAIRDEQPLWNVAAEASGYRRNVEVTTPIEELKLWWDEGEVWVDG